MTCSAGASGSHGVGTSFQIRGFFRRTANPCRQQGSSRTHSGARASQGSARPSWPGGPLRRELGTTFTRMVRKERVARTRLLLETRDELPVAEVARLVGYDDTFYFSRVFRVPYGMNPSGWWERVLTSEATP